jgi:hypothetical protein
MTPRRQPNAAERDRLRTLRDSVIDCDIAVDDRRRELSIAEQAESEDVSVAEQALAEAIALRDQVARDLAALLAELEHA